MFHEAGFLNVKVKVILLLSAEHSAGSKNVIQKVTLQTPVDFVESLCYKDFYALFSCPEQKKISLSLRKRRNGMFLSSG